MRSLVIIPTYNERDNLPALAEAVLAADPTLDILIVDDDSPDGTGRTADEIAAGDSRIAVLHRSGKQGLGTAYVAGFRHALAHDYERVIQMDADFSHRPADLASLLQASEEAQVVIGSRGVEGGGAEGWPLHRHLLSRAGSLYARLLLRLPVHDATGGFKCFQRVALEALDLDALRSNGYAFQIEVTYACAVAGMRFAETPIRFIDRTRGKSKMSARIVGEAAVLVLRLRLGLCRPALLPPFTAPRR